MAPHEYKPYGGTARKLVLAFDIGTTFSGAAYAVLDPGEVPTIQTIQRYPAQSNDGSKIPSIIIYKKDGKVRAVGAEATDPGMMEEMEDETKDLQLVEWFKMHLMPSKMSNDNKMKDLDVQHQLPPGKTVVDVFADFLRYLHKCAREYIIGARTNGASLWNSVKDHVEIVLTHPNGWEGSQQGKLRESAVLAGLVPDTTAGHERIHLVSEGEASLHFCVDAGMTSEFTDRTGVIIIDAGGGTIDLSSYLFNSVSPIDVEESAAAECAVEGSTRVNTRATKMFRSKFANAGTFGTDIYIKAMTDAFDKGTKPTFKDPNEKSFIRFGGLSDNSEQFGIRNGRFSVKGAEIAKLFEPAISATLTAVRRQKAAAADPPTFAFLVGGFAASKYLADRLSKELKSLGITLSRPDHHAQKAVAIGAASHYIEHYVSARVARFTFGTETIVPFDPSDPEHRSRRSKVVPSALGFPAIPDAFGSLIKKGKSLREGEEIVEPFMMGSRSPAFLESTSLDILCYKGKRKDPKWVDEDCKSFETLCTIHADTSKVKVMTVRGLFGVTFLQEYDVVLSCGKTELTAYLRWTEDGVVKRGPASVVYNEDN